MWVQCPANQPVNLFITNDPLIFRDNPADNPRVVANLGEYGGDAFNGDLEYAWIASPHLAGMPIDAAGAQLLADSWAMRAIATHAGQISAESQSAAALFTQAIAALGLDTADPGMTFVEPPVVVVA